MSISVRLNEAELNAVKSYAKSYDMTVSDLIRKAVLELVEDEYDLECYKQAIAEYETNPKTYSLDEVIESYGKDDDE